MSRTRILSGLIFLISFTSFSFVVSFAGHGWEDSKKEAEDQAGMHGGIAEGQKMRTAGPRVFMAAREEGPDEERRHGERQHSAFMVAGMHGGIAEGQKMRTVGPRVSMAAREEGPDEERRHGERQHSAFMVAGQRREDHGGQEDGEKGEAELLTGVRQPGLNAGRRPCDYELGCGQAGAEERDSDWRDSQAFTGYNREAEQGDWSSGRRLLRVSRADLEAYKLALDGAIARGRALNPRDTLARIERQLAGARRRLELFADLHARREDDADANADDGKDDADEDADVAGPVYLNAPLFRRSHAEMERLFRIYVYSEEKRPLTHESGTTNIYAIDGYFFLLIAQKNKFVTKNPAHAHMFFVPFAVVNIVKKLNDADDRGRRKCRNFTTGYVNEISAKYPFWNRTHGADHFMLSCHDWGPAVTRGNFELSSVASHFVCNSNDTEGFFKHKDLPLPEISINGRGGLPDPKTLGGPPPEERDIFAFFAGKTHGPVRPKLFAHWRNRDPDIHVYQGRIPEDVVRKISYDEHMRRSKYCLCPGGYHVNSPRIVEAIYRDCLPVIIADSFVLPFSDTLNWTAFSIVLPEADIPNLKEKLLAVPEDVYLSKQANLKIVRRHFVINMPSKKYDVFHMIMHSLWLRRLNMRFT